MPIAPFSTEDKKQVLAGVWGFFLSIVKGIIDMLGMHGINQQMHLKGTH